MGIGQEFLEVLLLIARDPEIWEIAFLSLYVSITAVSLASIVGVPIGLGLGIKSERNRWLPTSLLNTAMGLPPVLVGLVVYLLLTRQGPLGQLSLLFTPLAMIFAQMVLTLPIIIGITRSTIRDLPNELPEMLESLGGTSYQIYREITIEARAGILIAIIVALGRAFSEVGAILIVGGNIRYDTRVLTTAIITEVNKGERTTALALGVILLSISFALTSMMTFVQIRARNN